MRRRRRAEAAPAARPLRAAGDAIRHATAHASAARQAVVGAEERARDLLRSMPPLATVDMVAANERVRRVEAKLGLPELRAAVVAADETVAKAVRERRRVAGELIRAETADRQGEYDAAVADAVGAVDALEAAVGRMTVLAAGLRAAVEPAARVAAGSRPALRPEPPAEATRAALRRWAANAARAVVDRRSAAA